MFSSIKRFNETMTHPETGKIRIDVNHPNGMTADASPYDEQQLNAPNHRIIQGSLFPELGVDHNDATGSAPISLSMPNADVRLYPNFFLPEESDRLFQHLLDEIPWRQDYITLYGKTVPLPRKTAWHGDDGASYSYSGIDLDPEPWTPALLEVRTRIEDAVEVSFNSVLLNLYRHGRDSMSWHSDDEPELGRNPMIASVSFGEARRFIFRHRQNKALKTEVQLTHGSFLLMAGETQHFWQHAIPKTTRAIAPRINLTFRVIQP
ncbi:MAG: alpha-ketoglutarate-dependent dioxygenase AlkB [Cyanobacteria bacterium J06626_14]